MEFDENHDPANVLKVESNFLFLSTALEMAGLIDSLLFLFDC